MEVVRFSHSGLLTHRAAIETARHLWGKLDHSYPILPHPKAHKNGPTNKTFSTDHQHFPDCLAQLGASWVLTTPGTSDIRGVGPASVLQVNDP